MADTPGTISLAWSTRIMWSAIGSSSRRAISPKNLGTDEQSRRNLLPAIQQSGAVEESDAESVGKGVFHGSPHTVLQVAHHGILDNGLAQKAFLGHRRCIPRDAAHSLTDVRQVVGLAAGMDPEAARAAMTFREPANLSEGRSRSACRGGACKRRPGHRQIPSRLIVAHH